MTEVIYLLLLRQGHIIFIHSVLKLGSWHLSMYQWHVRKQALIFFILFFYF